MATGPSYSLCLKKLVWRAGPPFPRAGERRAQPGSELGDPVPWSCGAKRRLRDPSLSFPREMLTPRSPAFCRPFLQLSFPISEKIPGLQTLFSSAHSLPGQPEFRVYSEGEFCAKDLAPEVSFDTAVVHRRVISERILSSPGPYASTPPTSAGIPGGGQQVCYPQLITAVKELRTLCTCLFSNS